ncbi:MAG: Ig-like domain-containing protein, partial [Verrucomicrobiae bacterium]|nr:Ig-like domain-containing protein [Verrucomicrobiae bacterium]
MANTNYPIDVPTPRAWPHLSDDSPRTDHHGTVDFSLNRTLRRALLVAVSVLAGGSSSAFADYLVNFEGSGETKGAYASGSVTLSGISWNMTEALITTSTASDYVVDVRSARLRGYATSAMTMEADKSGGAGTISFVYRQYGSDAQQPWAVEISSNAGSTWSQVGSDFTATSSVATFSETVNLSGDVRFRIVCKGTGTSNRRMNLDNLNVTDYGGGPDVTAPVLQSFSPADDFPAALTNTVYELTYDEPMAAGTGTVTVKKVSDSSVVETITVPSAQVEFDGSVVKVTPTVLLDEATEYYVEVSAGAFTDIATNAAAAAGGNPDWTFTTRSNPSVLISQYYEGQNSSDRYVELKNLTGSPLLLDGYVLAAWSHSDPAGREGWKTGTDTTNRVTALDGLTIPANGNLLVAQLGASLPGYAA